MPDALTMARIADCSACAYPSKISPELFRLSTKQFLEIFRWLGFSWDNFSILRQSTRQVRYKELNDLYFGGKLEWDWINIIASPVSPPIPSPTTSAGHSPLGVLSRAADHHDHGAIQEHYGADHERQFGISMDYWLRMFGKGPEFCYVPILNHGGVKQSKSNNPGVLFRDVQRSSPARVWQVLSRLASRGQCEFPAIWPPRLLDQEEFSYTLRWIPGPEPIEVRQEHFLEMIGESRPRVQARGPLSAAML